MRNKVFKWFEFLKECELKTIIGIVVSLFALLGTLYATQSSITKWIMDTDNAIIEGRKAIEKGNEREKKLVEHETRICVLESNYKSIDNKLDILIARIK